MQEPLSQLPIPLLRWYEENARTLPWREAPTPYRVWVSEIMLQQTRVTAVLDYFARFMETFPTIQDLANAPEDVLMKQWQGLGYYSRARNLQKAARQIMTDFGGVFPTGYADIRSLSGIGDYTAAAISSICYGLPIPAVDGNLLRVSARILGDAADITTTKGKKHFTTLLQAVIPTEFPGQFNQAMMDLGATICLPNGAPLCESCPARECCVAYATQQTMSLPTRTPKKPRRIEERTVFLLVQDGKIALRRRPSKGLLAGLWEYPNRLSSEGMCLEDWGLKEPPVFVGTGTHIFTHVEWHMTAVTGHFTEETLPEGWVLASLAELAERYAIPSAFRPFQSVVKELLS